MDNTSPIDIPVALIFFTRPEPLSEVFKKIRQAKPSKLFLIQDGPREHSDTDADKIKECRDIVTKIDWECEVYKNFSDKNLGVGMRIYSGLTWAFQYVDRLVILEDDCVPNYSFFKFCNELLERYKADERINMISGMNHLGAYQTPNSYFYSKVGSIWGWATWKRVWDQVDYNMEFLSDDVTMTLFKNACQPKSTTRALIKKGIERKINLDRGQKLTAWTYQFRMVRHLQSQLVIVPSKNLICNIGVTVDSAHAKDSLNKMPKGIRRVFFMETHELKFPLNHPRYMIEDVTYDNKVRRIMGGDSILIRIYRKAEMVIRSLFS